MHGYEDLGRQKPLVVSLGVIRISFTMKFYIVGCNQLEACVDISEQHGCKCKFWRSYHQHSRTRAHSRSNSYIAKGNAMADELAKDGLSIALSDD